MRAMSPITSILIVYYQILLVCTQHITHTHTHINHHIYLICIVCYYIHISHSVVTVSYIFTHYISTYTYHTWWYTHHIYSIHKYIYLSIPYLDKFIISHSDFQYRSSILIKSWLAWHFSHFLILVSHSTGSSY